MPRPLHPDMDVPLFKKEDMFLPKLKGHVKSFIQEGDKDSLTLRKVLRQRVREHTRAREGGTVRSERERERERERVAKGCVMQEV